MNFDFRVKHVHLVLFSFVLGSLFVGSATAQMTPAPPTSPPDRLFTYDQREQARKALADGAEALKKGDYRLAEEKFEEVLSYSPNDPLANYLMGLAKIGADKKKAAVRYLEKAISRKKDYIEARETLGLLEVELGRNDKAEAQLEALKQLREKCSDEGCDDARLELAIGKLEQALQNAKAS